MKKKKKEGNIVLQSPREARIDLDLWGGPLPDPSQLLTPLESSILLVTILLQLMETQD